MKLAARECPGWADAGCFWHRWDWPRCDGWRWSIVLATRYQQDLPWGGAALTAEAVAVVDNFGNLVTVPA